MSAAGRHLNLRGDKSFRAKLIHELCTVDKRTQSLSGREANVSISAGGGDVVSARGRAI